jgi:hypothetical protein
MATHEIRVDFSRPLTGEPDKGHNRWHPEIPPVVRCPPGDEVVMETAMPSTCRWARFHHRGGGQRQPQRGASAHRPGVRGGCRAGRPPGGRDPRGRPALGVRLHGPDPRLRLPA